jgi:hypothetical protein
VKVHMLLDHDGYSPSSTWRRKDFRYESLPSLQSSFWREYLIWSDTWTFIFLHAVRGSIFC